ncbi:MAG TPA: AAA family ATPase [Staphylococcus kloosii]|uniref:AAA family ATPase n=1 Tax=Staphylococcus kloosii TaxID=29384 RepID=A0A921H0B2_9STAP|nr:DnaB helicase C-terminal domain-containing protein [Staphylococcus kloosii]HJF68544.1 AAA family ATPase [Staphylococcus kloosii]
MMNKVFNLTEDEAILANILQNDDLLENLKIKPEMFSDGSVAIVIDYLLNQGKVDLNALYHKARKTNNFMSVERIGSLYNSDEVYKSFFMQEQKDVMEKYKIREINRITKEFQQSLMTEQDRLYMVEEIEKVEQLSVKTENTLKNQLLEFVDNFLSDEPKNFIKTGLENIDRQIIGFEPTQLIILGARPGAGKTAVALNMMYNIARNGYPVTFFSLETTDQKILERLVSSTSNVDMLKIIQKTNISDKEANRVMQAVDKIDKLHGTGFEIIDKAHVTQQDIRQAAMKQYDKPQVIFIDYLQLLNPDKSQKDRRLDVEKISRDLKIIAKENNCVIVALSQLSRGVESRQNKRPMLSDLRESGSIEQDANMVMFLYREDYYDEMLQDKETGVSEVECNVAKNRDGVVGMVPLNFHKFTQKFTSKVI